MASRQTKRLRALIRRPEDPCYYCGRPCQGRPYCDPTLDHIVPKGRGGSNSRHNVVLSCIGCNETKMDMTAPEFVHFLHTGTLHPDYIAHFTESTRKRAIARNIHLWENCAKIVPPSTANEVPTTESR